MIAGDFLEVIEFVKTILANWEKEALQEATQWISADVVNHLLRPYLQAPFSFIETPTLPSDTDNGEIYLVSDETDLYIGTYGKEADFMIYASLTCSCGSAEMYQSDHLDTFEQMRQFVTGHQCPSSETIQTFGIVCQKIHEMSTKI